MADRAWGRIIQRQQRVLLQAAALVLRALREEKRSEEDREGEADEDGDGENFHGL